MKLELEISDQELLDLLAALEDLSLQVDAEDMKRVNRLLNRIRIAGGLTEQKRWDDLE